MYAVDPAATAMTIGRAFRWSAGSAAARSAAR